VSIYCKHILLTQYPIGQRQRQRKRKNEWAEELKFDPVLCKCGIEAKYGLVPSKLGVGYFCGHMVDYDEVGIYLLFAPAVMLDLYVLFFVGDEEMQLRELRQQRRGDAHNKVQETNGTEDALWISARRFLH
jgi:hypothetical protein